MARERDAPGHIELMQLDVKDEEERALLHAVPSIVAALLPHLARETKCVVVVFSTRRGDPALRVLAPDVIAETLPELATAISDAPKMPAVRVLLLRRDGAITARDTRVTDLAEMEETAPS